jgi:hypothetical protein
MAAGAVMTHACGSREPRTDAERLARGREIVERMSAKLGATQAFSVTTLEVRDEVKPSGQPQRVSLTRETTVRRPDRLYSKVTGDHDNEVWYDGVGFTVVLHNQKIFGQGRAPENLDKALDAIHERYGVAAPVADYLYTSPAKALLADSTTGGWVGRETGSGVALEHLAFKDQGVNWEIWVPATGDPLPQKAIAEFHEDKRLRKVELTFKNWNLSPQIADNQFSPTVPADYEGVAILQRARILRSMPKEEERAAPTVGVKR